MNEDWDEFDRRMREAQDQHDEGIKALGREFEGVII